MKTLLLAGPSGVGKKMLVHAVCSETGAHLFHLNPAHLSTRYPGRTAYLLHLVFKVSLALLETWKTWNALHKSAPYSSLVILENLEFILILVQLRHI